MAITSDDRESQSFMKHLQASLATGMNQAAEPLIQEALKNIEVVMREKLAQMCIARREHQYSMYRNGNDLNIVVKNIFPAGGSHG
jgi:hypothetical protein